MIEVWHALLEYIIICSYYLCNDFDVFVNISFDFGNNSPSISFDVVPHKSQNFCLVLTFFSSRYLYTYDIQIKKIIPLKPFIHEIQKCVSVFHQIILMYFFSKPQNIWKLSVHWVMGDKFVWKINDHIFEDKWMWLKESKVDNEWWLRCPPSMIKIKSDLECSPDLTPSDF